jgi:ABC-type polar amino acid transport system ATPase subunit
MELLRQVSLGDKFEAWPSELSGGQKQRVAIARALAMNPDVLLLDEVTSALDVEMVSGINDLLTRLAATGMTMVVVTHDISFAMQVAHRICFFDEGRIVESGTPESLIERAQSPRLLEFLSAVQGTTREKSKSG